MVARSAVLRSIALSFTAVVSTGAQSTTAPAPLSPTRFQSSIDAYLRADSTARPKAGEIIFIGSSIFARWSNLAVQMAPLPAHNRAFGGSQTPDVLYYMNDVVVPYKPRFVVYYCGSNDVNARRSAGQILTDIRAFHDRLERALPAAHMFFVSVIRAPDKRARWPVVDSVNTAMRDYATKVKNLEFIDVNPVLLDAKGSVRGELYLPDSLHYVAPTYDLFTSVIKPVLQRAWAAR